MGRAARHKRQRRTARPWTTTNPWTGEHETFMVSVSDESLHQWERDRARLRDQGYPDRPPAVDTPTERAWGELPASLEGSSLRLRSDPTARLVGSWQVEKGGVVFKANLGQRPDGQHVLQVLVGPTHSPREIEMVMGPDREAAMAVPPQLARAAHLGVPRFVSAETIMAGLRRAG